MIDLGDVTLLFIVLLLAYITYSAMRIRELAFKTAARHCKQLNLQLLDQSVSIKSVWFKRDKQGAMRFWRSYKFEFSSMGDERYHGLVVMLGELAESVELEPYRIPPAEEQGGSEGYDETLH